MCFSSREKSMFYWLLSETSPPIAPYHHRYHSEGRWNTQEDNLWVTHTFLFKNHPTSTWMLSENWKCKLFCFFPHLILVSFNFVNQPFGLVQSCCTPKKQTHEKWGEKTSIRKDIVERFSCFRNTFETVQLTYELPLRVISAVVVVNV